jgi:hypothetical protein
LGRGDYDVSGQRKLSPQAPEPRETAYARRRMRTRTLPRGLPPSAYDTTLPDAALLNSMTREEFVGRKGRVSHDAAAQKNPFEA